MFKRYNYCSTRAPRLGSVCWQTLDSSKLCCRSIRELETLQLCQKDFFEEALPSPLWVKAFFFFFVGCVTPGLHSFSRFISSGVLGFCSFILSLLIDINIIQGSVLLPFFSLLMKGSKVFALWIRFSVSGV